MTRSDVETLAYHVYMSYRQGLTEGYSVSGVATLVVKAEDVAEVLACENLLHCDKILLQCGAY